MTKIILILFIFGVIFLIACSPIESVERFTPDKDIPCASACSTGTHCFKGECVDNDILKEECVNKLCGTCENCARDNNKCIIVSQSKPFLEGKCAECTDIMVKFQDHY